MVRLPVVTESEFTVTPEGVYIMSLKDFEDGIEGNPQYGGGERCRWVFTIERVVSALDDEAAAEQVGEEFWAWTSKTMSTRSNMYKYITALVGRPLAAGEQLDTDDLIGRKVKVNVVEYEKADGSVGTKIGGMQPYAAKRGKNGKARVPTLEETDSFEDFEAASGDPF